MRARAIHREREELTMAPLQRVTIYLTDKEMDMMEKKCRDCEKAFGFRPTTKQQGDMYKHAFFVHRSES
jgi:hypothetical protein